MFWLTIVVCEHVIEFRVTKFFLAQRLSETLSLIVRLLVMYRFLMWYVLWSVQVPFRMLLNMMFP